MRPFIVVILFLAASAAFAKNDRDPHYVWRDTGIVESGHAWQLTLGLGYRSDENRWVKEDLTLECGIMRFVTPGMAFVLTTAYTPNAETDFVHNNQDIDITSANLSLRLQDAHARWSPFGELGYDLKQYSGNLGTGHAWRKSSGGISYGIGLTVRLNPRYAVDLSLSQVINHARVWYAVNSDLPYPPGGERIRTYNQFSDSFYNPTHLQIHLRVGL